MGLLKFLPVHFSTALIVGIVTGYHFNFDLKDITACVLFVYLLLIFTYFKANKSFQLPVFFVVFTSVMFFLIGVLSVAFQKPKNQKNNYYKFYNSQSYLVLRIDKVLKTGKFYKRFEAEVIQVNQQKTSGRISVQLETKVPQNFIIDDVILVKGTLHAISKTKNPNAFDYQKYLKTQGVYHQIKLGENDFIQLKSKQKTMRGFVFRLRQNIYTKLRKYAFTKEELSIINALILGDRTTISKQIFTDYKNAGAIHILAVSGLHIGIILLLLNFVFYPIKYIKNGKLLKLFLVVICLWMYAIFVGFSASVVRAVTMFTAIAVGLFLDRKSGVLHSLIISLFVLLLLHPLFLFDVGFQLSYTAVFSIVCLQPYFNNLLHPKSKIVRYFWQILTVSFAAQIGILPLSLYYFHQFPSLFFVSSLVIIPFLGIILGLGLLVIVLSFFQILPSFIANFYAIIIRLMNTFVATVAEQETFIFGNLGFSLVILVLIYLILVFLIRWLFDRNYKNSILFFIAITLFQIASIYNKYKTQTTQDFIVFHQAKHTILGIRKGENMEVLVSPDSMKKAKKIVTDYGLEFPNLKINYNKKQKNILRIDSKNILIVDGIGVYKNLNFLPETVILTQSPKVNLDRLIKTIQPKLVVVDGSNFKSYINRWEKTCKNNGVKFYNTTKNGAYRHRY